MLTPEFFKQRRQAKGLTRAELARQLGVSGQWLYLLESRPLEHMPSVDKAQKLADILEFDVREWTK